jgi:hypothetical protein
MVYWERVQRVQEWVAIHHEDYIFQPSRLRTCEHSANGRTGLKKPTRHSLRFILYIGVVCENCTQHSPWTTGIQKSVCMVGTKICDGSSQKLMFGGAFFFFFLFRGGANKFPQSMVTMWDMGSPFYTKWALLQWTHLSSLGTTKYKVCQYAGLWQLYSMLQESSALYSNLKSKSKCEHMLWHAVLTALGY